MVIDLLNFAIIAKVIYQSSRVNRTQSDVSLLCYLREQYLQLQKKSICEGTLGNEEAHFGQKDVDRLLLTTNEQASEDRADSDVEVNDAAQMKRVASTRIKRSPNAIAVEKHRTDPNRSMVEEVGDRNDSMHIENLLGRDDFHLCEGLLTIFIKGTSKQTVVFDWRDNKSKASSNNRESRNLAGNQYLDLGSCKETISLLESGDT